MIYCVEDDRNIRELIVYTLKASGMEAEGFSDYEMFSKALAKTMPKLILLDIMLPQKDGISILKELRSCHMSKNIPVIMITAKGSEYDKVLGLDSGADDYITKPFGMMELISRIKAVLRRYELERDQTIFIEGPLTVNLSTHEVCVESETINLTKKEFELLVKLIGHKNQVFSRDQLLDDLWGYNYEGETRTVDVHMRTLRQKLGDAGNMIKTVRGVGYKLGGYLEEKNI